MGRLIIDEIRSANYDRNVWRDGYGKDDKDNCLVCGKLLKRTEFWLHMTIYGELLRHDEQVPEADSQGLFAVGRECVRKHNLADYILTR